MASTKPIEIVVAILLLLITAFLILFALFYNIKGSSMDIRQNVIGSFQKISTVLNIPYKPSRVDTDIKIPQVSYDSASGMGGQGSTGSSDKTTPLGKDTCKNPNGSNCIIPSNNPENDNEGQVPYYNKECILKDEYMNICKYIS